jgi:hypothetical protein
MESSTTNGTAPSRPGRSRRGRALAVAVLAAGTAAATLAPVTAAAGASERSAPAPRSGPAAVRGWSARGCPFRWTGRGMADGPSRCR